MSTKFYIKQYDYERGYDDEDDTLVSETLRRCDMREALRAMNDFCADSEDWRCDEVILYPADHYMDPRTGRIHTTHLVIGSTNPRHFRRLGDYDAACRRVA